MPKWLLVVLTAIFGAIFKNVSPVIRDAIEDFLVKLEKKAKETPNVFDDMIVDLLKDIFKVE